MHYDFTSKDDLFKGELVTMNGDLPSKIQDPVLVHRLDR